VDPTDAAHVLQTPEEYAEFLGGLSFEKRIAMVNSFRCAELQGAEELRALAETVDDPALARKFARHAADEEKHGADFEEIMRRLGAEPFDPPDEPDHITIGGRLIVDTLNDIEEILPRRGETVGLDRVIPILTLFQVVERRALVSFEAHRRTFEESDPVIAQRIGEIIADESHHARYVRALLDRWAEEGWADVVREAQEATDVREAGAREWAAERLEAERLREEGKLSAT
jgi:rubrerythrin